MTDVRHKLSHIRADILVTRKSHACEIADISHSMTHMEWHTWRVSLSVFQSHMYISHMCLSNDIWLVMSVPMNHTGVWEPHLWDSWLVSFDDTYRVTHLHLSSSVIPSHIPITYMCHSNDTCRYLSCVFRITFDCLATNTCHKSHVPQSNVRNTCVTHVLVTTQSIVTRRTCHSTNDWQE